MSIVIPGGGPNNFGVFPGQGLPTPSIRCSRSLGSHQHRSPDGPLPGTTIS